MEVTTAERVLEKATEILSDPSHWTKGGYVDPHAEEQSYCAMGAIRVANAMLTREYDNESDYYHAAISPTWGAGTHAVRALSDVIAEDGWYSIPEWNDAPNRRHKEVIAAFEKAAALAAERGW